MKNILFDSLKKDGVGAGGGMCWQLLLEKKCPKIDWSLIWSIPNLHSVWSSCATFLKASIESSNQDFFLWCYSLLLKKEQRGHLLAWSRQPQLPRCLLYIFRLPTLLNLGTYRVSTYLPYVMAVHCKYIQWKYCESAVKPLYFWKKRNVLTLDILMS